MRGCHRSRRDASCRSRTSILALTLVALVLSGLAGAGHPRAQEAPTAAASEGGIVKVSIGGRKLILPALTHDGSAYVSLKAAAAALGGALKLGKRAGDAVLSVAGRTLAFEADAPDLVRHDAGAATLSHPARPAPGDLQVPADFFAAILAPLVDRPIETAPAAASAGASGTLDVSIVGGRDTLRLVFECRQPVAWKLDESPSELTLHLGEKAGEPPWPTRVLGTPVLRSMAFEPPRAGQPDLLVHLVKGEAFSKAAVSELKNPFRVVLEVQGGESAARSAAPVAAGAEASRGGLRTIVLDPGHGGEQKGAEGKGGLLEKEITLDVARRLQDLLRQEGLTVILTRTEDSDVGLVDRTAVANREKAGLFLSIHVNASPRSQARGAETYYLAYQALDRESGALADAENAAGTAAPDAGAAGGGTDMILWDLAQSEHLRESAELAQIVQKAFDAALGVRDRGVKQAPFRVLMGAAMPAVLVEIGFLSNAEEEAALRTPEYRDRIAAALHEAIISFKKNADLRSGAPAP